MLHFLKRTERFEKTNWGVKHEKRAVVNIDKKRCREKITREQKTKR